MTAASGGAGPGDDRTPPRTPPDEESRFCADASGARGEDVAGTASTVRSFLLVESPGPWGVDAVRDNRMPGPVKQGLARRANDAGVRVLFIRPFHRGVARQDFRVFAARAGTDDSWSEGTTLHAAEDLLEVDLAALGEGRSPGLDPVAGSLFGVCTHGRHDACCARHGRPVARALASARPEDSWEISHIGGDRFAGNMLVLPEGLYYGRLDAESGPRVAATHEQGHLDLDHLRGRSSVPMPVQAAEIALRRRLGLTRRDAVRHVGRRRDGDLTSASFRVGEQWWQVEVRTVADGEPRQLTCSATRLAPAPRHVVVAVRPDA